MSDRAGDMLASNLGPITDQRVSIADQEQFRVPRDAAGDDLFINRPLIGLPPAAGQCSSGRRLFDASGAFDGVIVASLDPAFLSRLYTLPRYRPRRAPAAGPGRDRAIGRTQ